MNGSKEENLWVDEIEKLVTEIPTCRTKHHQLRHWEHGHTGLVGQNLLSEVIDYILRHKSLNLEKFE